ncbi:Spy/CpxP family protein refolding chaperone [Baaleninema simplex]|uniref:Spy/CpxP family protein refolding chaperone n=1 Tax=Baaleninema simplex TaxID=2862350 RepID=UPI00034623A7|nr:Spy/CpxP family protein refolding chaperone [Baaleninema simplex]
MKRLVQLGSVVAIAVTTLTTGVTSVRLSPATAQMPPPTILEELELTAEQQAQLEQIRADYQTQLATILTDAQRRQLANAMRTASTPQEFRRAIATVDLTQAQRNELRTILQGVRQDMATVLTEEQQQELRELTSEVRRRRR